METVNEKTEVIEPAEPKSTEPKSSEPKSFVENPFLAKRNETGWTQVEIAKLCDVSPQFIMKIEQGLFRTVPRKVVDRYKDHFGLNEDWIHQYRRFQLLTRRLASRPVGKGRIIQFPDPFTFQDFRILNWPHLTKAGWCKAFCIHPSTLYATENNPGMTLSKEIEISMLDSAVMSSGEIYYLKELIREVYFG